MQPTRDTQSYPGTASRDRHRASPVSLSLMLLSAGFAGLSLSSAAGQTPSQQTPSQQAPASQAAATSPDTIKQREQELEAAREQQRKAAEQQQKLKADSAAI